MENSNLVKEKIHQKLKDVDFKSNQLFKYLIPIITILLFGLIAFVGFKTIKSPNITSFIIIAILMFVTFGIIVGLSIFAALIGKNNQKLLKKVVGLDLHNIYFDNLNNPFSPLEFKFKGIEKSSIFGNHCLKFQLGAETIIWNIDEDIEIRHIGSGDEDETETVYILKFVLVSSSKKLSGIKGISISKAKKIDLLKKDFLFKAESMEFNQKYRVESVDEMDVYKLFTPKVIENFNISDLDLSAGEQIWLADDLAKIDFRSKREAYRSWIPDPLDFSAIRWGKNRGKTVDDIYNKIKLDFDRYFENQELLEPLELY